MDEGKVSGSNWGPEVLGLKLCLQSHAMYISTGAHMHVPFHCCYIIFRFSVTEPEEVKERQEHCSLVPN